MKGFNVSVLMAAFVASAGAVADVRVHTVSSADFGDTWPFTVASVDLICDGPPAKALARTSDGTVYALSGSARSAAKSRGWADGRDITKPSLTMPAVKVDYSNIVQIAQDLCPKP